MLAIVVPATTVFTGCEDDDDVAAGDTPHIVHRAVVEPNAYDG